VRCTKRSGPIPDSFDAIIDAEVKLQRACCTQFIVGVSSLAATVVLLVQVLPPLVNGFS
jgi:hypothetical protein